MLFLLGIGYKKEDLNDEIKDLINKSTKIYLEYYTSFYETKFEDLEEYLNKEITICDRKFMEEEIDSVLIRAQIENIAILVIGDPLVATTHTDLILRARKLSIDVKIVNNISVANLVGRTGLQFYKFGKIISIPFYSEKFLPRTPYLNYLNNCKIDAHTLFLLDLNPLKKDICKNAEFLSIQSALDYFFKIQPIVAEEFGSIRKERLITEETKIVICSRLGFKDEVIIYEKIKNILTKESILTLQPPLSIIIPSKLHELEEEYLLSFSFNSDLIQRTDLNEKKVSFINDENLGD